MHAYTLCNVLRSKVVFLKSCETCLGFATNTFWVLFSIFYRNQPIFLPLFHIIEITFICSCIIHCVVKLNSLLALQRVQNLFFRTFQKVVRRAQDLQFAHFGFQRASHMSHTNGTFIYPMPKLEMSPKLNANFYCQSCLNRQSHKNSKHKTAVEITTKWHLYAW